MPEQSVSDEEVERVEAFAVLTRELNEKVKRAFRALEHLEEHGCGVYHWREGETCEWQTRCDEPGCKQQVTSGTPTPAGYRSTCSEHRP